MAPWLRGIGLRIHRPISIGVSMEFSMRECITICDIVDGGIER